MLSSSMPQIAQEAVSEDENTGGGGGGGGGG